MTREEQKQITGFINEAVGSGAATSIPPLDVEADAIIRALFARNPEAAYRVTMLAIERDRQFSVCRTQLSEARLQAQGWLMRLKRKLAFLRARPRPVPPQQCFYKSAP